jgi:3-deoxy-D-manno-octulosonic-acid transferase
MRSSSAINLRERLWRLVYGCLLFIGRPLVRLRLAWRGRREPAYRERTGERFGEVPAHVPVGPLWVHAVSAGETIAAVPLIERLLAIWPHVPVLVTTTTPTGSGEVQKRLGDRVYHCYAPYDFADAVSTFFHRVQPRGLILMETELWPNMLRAAEVAGIPVALINGRLSARSARGYARVGALSRSMLRTLYLVGCQSDAHRQRFIALGADPDRTRVLGTVKYDLVLDAAVRARARSLRQDYGWQQQPVWIAASTHPGEDAQVLEAYAMARSRVDGLRLLLVPRHPSRAGEIMERVRAEGHDVALQSTLAGAASTVVIGDVMGSLLMLYGVADTAFVGGSLVAAGGHNPIEAAVWGKPVITGPHTWNFADVIEAFRTAQAVIEVQDAQTLGRAVVESFVARETVVAMGARGESLVMQNAGALERTLRALEPMRLLLTE